DPLQGQPGPGPPHDLRVQVERGRDRPRPELTRPSVGPQVLAQAIDADPEGLDAGGHVARVAGDAVDRGRDLRAGRVRRLADGLRGQEILIEAEHVWIVELVDREAVDVAQIARETLRLGARPGGLDSGLVGVPVVVEGRENRVVIFYSAGDRLDGPRI